MIKRTYHGHANKGKASKPYKVWAGMVARCGNPNHTTYSYYGGRGISVCKEWRNDFTTFNTWLVSQNYSNGLTVDRIDNDGDYSPENCRLVTHKENCQNTRSAVMTVLFGETKCIHEWLRDPRVKVSHSQLYRRLNSGIPAEIALSTPTRNKKHPKPP